MSYETLCVVWFFLLGVLLIGYAILDGFDLGVGMLHLFVPRSNDERRILMNSIGPIWDGNEVWLVTFGGAMFAAFPEAYATIFSGFYTALMIVLFALILRAVSLEFRGKVRHRGWRRAWDVMFFLGSTLATFIFGVAVGNAIKGVPLDEAGEYAGTIFNQLDLYGILVGVLAVTLFAMHGAIFLYLKTGGPLKQRLHFWMWRTFGLFLTVYLLTTIVTLVAVPHAAEPFRQYPILWIVPVLNVLAIANIPRAIFLNRPGYAFISSCATIAALIFLLGAASFPNLVTSRPNPDYSLTVFNAASSYKTLTIMLIIVVIGMPCVLAYTTIVYRTFSGTVELGEHSY